MPNIAERMEYQVRSDFLRVNLQACSIAIRVFVCAELWMTPFFTHSIRYDNGMSARWMKPRASTMRNKK